MKDPEVSIFLDGYSPVYNTCIAPLSQFNVSSLCGRLPIWTLATDHSADITHWFCDLFVRAVPISVSLFASFLLPKLDIVVPYF
jgi:hypothetical protein